ncbi:MULTISPECIES: hypothetical protein [Kitasatospora]|uniref:YbaB/EbfC DNA-binding family protein n=1 Tax=Kitasatospora setae (strain ATCC 33774 / DSM 43861 / JCM 3304 / KCC A-0304 / NBRC 14216 / KM-6054) TaxID=452652 RepID=E4NDM2_KITSK|nr:MULTISPECIES: hypothetical protein [Kitasatospora]BAJ29303.1 hypothetical protein KSE_34970 [Kitasatospora setae KM-6054]
MDSRTIDELNRIREQALLLGGALRRAADALPAREEGEDSSGLVRVVIDADGIPESIVIGAGWKSRIRAEDLGATVREAAAAAGMRRMEAWSRELDRDDHRDAYDRGVESVRTGRTDHRASAPQDAPNESGSTARPLQDVIEDILELSRRVGSEETPLHRSASVTVFNSSRTVTVTLTPTAFVSAEIDPRWADSRSGSELSREIQSTVTAARARLAAAAAEQTGPPGAGEQLERLLGESMAALRDPARFVQHY